MDRADKGMIGWMSTLVGGILLGFVMQAKNPVDPPWSEFALGIWLCVGIALVVAGSYLLYLATKKNHP